MNDSQSEINALREMVRVRDAHIAELRRDLESATGLILDLVRRIEGFMKVAQDWRPSGEAYEPEGGENGKDS